MSTAASSGNNYLHTLKDDLKSFIYIILYCAMWWLPVNSKTHIKWWLTDFFGASNKHGSSGHDNKQHNTLTHQYTKELKNKENKEVLEWLHKAMDLHYKANPPHTNIPNPEWDNGKALGTMWEEKLRTDLLQYNRYNKKTLNIKS